MAIAVRRALSAVLAVAVCGALLAPASARGGDGGLLAEQGLPWTDVAAEQIRYGEAAMDLPADDGLLFLASNDAVALAWSGWGPATVLNRESGDTSRLRFRFNGIALGDGVKFIVWTGRQRTGEGLGPVRLYALIGDQLREGPRVSPAVRVLAIDRGRVFLGHARQPREYLWKPATSQPLTLTRRDAASLLLDSAGGVEVRTTGSGLRFVTPRGVRHTRGVAALFSRDGGLVAVQRRLTKLAVLSPAGRLVRRVALPAGRAVSDFQWTAEGDLVVLTFLEPPESVDAMMMPVVCEAPEFACTDAAPSAPGYLYPLLPQSAMGQVYFTLGGA